MGNLDCFGLDYLNYLHVSTQVLNRHVPRKVGNSNKLKNLTGWHPAHDFSTMVRTLVHDYLENNEATQLVNTLVKNGPV